MWTVPCGFTESGHIDVGRTVYGDTTTDVCIYGAVEGMPLVAAVTVKLDNLRVIRREELEEE